MISPFTPPGTKVVCINDSERAVGSKPGIEYRKDGWVYLTEGQTYTVREITPDDRTVEGFSVLLGEIRDRIQPDGSEAGYSLRRFRRADLPSCLTEILERVPTPTKVDA